MTQQQIELSISHEVDSCHYSNGSVAMKAAILFSIFSVISACSTLQKHPNGNDQPLEDSQHSEYHSRSSLETKGQASWYGRRFHRRRTASGEKYNMHDLTAAHRTLPFGSKLLVRNLASGRNVVVRVNDRGPYRNNRLIDVSYAAGKKLGMIQSGIAPVEIRVIHP